MVLVLTMVSIIISVVWILGEQMDYEVEREYLDENIVKKNNKLAKTILIISIILLIILVIIKMFFPMENEIVNEYIEYKIDDNLNSIIYNENSLSFIYKNNNEYIIKDIPYSKIKFMESENDTNKIVEMRKVYKNMFLSILFLTSSSEDRTYWIVYTNDLKRIFN